MKNAELPTAAGPPSYKCIHPGTVHKAFPKPKPCNRLTIPIHVICGRFAKKSDHLIV